MIEVKLDEKTIREVTDTHIRAAIAGAITKDPTALVTKIVNQALNMKTNSYDRETIFETAVHKMIRDAAESTFKEWIAENKALISDAIEKRLNKEKKAFVAKVANNLVSGLASSFRVDCRLDKIE